MIPTSDVCLACQRRQLHTLPSGEWRARSVTTALKLRAGVSAVSVVLEAWLSARLEGGIPSTEDAAVYDTLSGVVALVMILSMAACALTFLRWLHLAVRTANMLGVSQDSPRWAVAYWFIPLANLIRPYQFLRDLRRALGGPAEERLLQWWWAAWVAASLGNRVSTSLTQRVENDGSLFSAALVTDIAVEATMLVGAMLCIRVVREVHSLLEDRVADVVGPRRNGPLTARE